MSCSTFKVCTHILCPSLDGTAMLMMIFMWTLLGSQKCCNRIIQRKRCILGSGIGWKSTFFTLQEWLWVTQKLLGDILWMCHSIKSLLVYSTWHQVCWAFQKEWVFMEAHQPACSCTLCMLDKLMIIADVVQNISNDKYTLLHVHTVCMQMHSLVRLI